MWQLSAWQTKLLLHAKSARTQCRIAYKEWALKRVDAFIEQVQESNPTPVWNLAKRLKFYRTKPKIACAPVLGVSTEVVRDPCSLVTLWAQQIAEEFSNRLCLFRLPRWNCC